MVKAKTSKNKNLFLLAIKRYLFSWIFGLLFFSGLPFFAFVIFISGDSCCGENTSLTMFMVTVVILILHVIAAFVANFLYKLIGNPKPGYQLKKGVLITWLPSGVLYILFVALLIIGFYI